MKKNIQPYKNTNIIINTNGSTYNDNLYNINKWKLLNYLNYNYNIKKIHKIKLLKLSNKEIKKINYKKLCKLILYQVSYLKKFINIIKIKILDIDIFTNNIWNINNNKNINLNILNQNNALFKFKKRYSIK